jgi:hypothetical protein
MGFIVPCHLSKLEESADLWRLPGGSGLGQGKGSNSGGTISTFDEEDTPPVGRDGMVLLCPCLQRTESKGRQAFKGGPVSRSRGLLY